MLPADVELLSIQLPGRGPRISEKPVASMEEAVAGLMPALLPELAAAPFAFFGHSMGSLLAFEAAREASRAGLETKGLFASGNVAPHVPDPNEKIAGLPDAEFLEELKKLNGIPQVILECRELLDLLLPVLKADFGVVEKYSHRPGESLKNPVLAFGGTRDPRTKRPLLEEWKETTSGSFTLEMLPGDHFFIDSARPQLLKSINRALPTL
jgi:medium-chain acyl-[acyl-carrier-protein] hydrolase